ncbi:predicted protein [Chaetoceros tenuissimus]|uniref:Uncharacterized protein n=1 Tax=Chaetoceros tenuissimus TaxID=426638 RepID=A0AAD3CZQ3_9STRA|nr:predicted protein [Chaetoceros tenuissimus]
MRKCNKRKEAREKRKNERKGKKAKKKNKFEKWEKVFGEKEHRVGLKDVEIIHTDNGEKVKEKKTNALKKFFGAMKSFIANDSLPMPKQSDGILYFDFPSIPQKEWMSASLLEGVYFKRSEICPKFEKYSSARTSHNALLSNNDFAFTTGGEVEMIFLRGKLNNPRHQSSLQILRKIMENDPTAFVVNGATGGADGTPSTSDIIEALHRFECIGTKSAVKVTAVKITGKSAKVFYRNKYNRECTYQFGAKLCRHVFHLAKKNQEYKDFVDEIEWRYSEFCPGIFSGEMKNDMMSLLVEIESLYLKYAPLMIDDDVNVEDFFNIHIKMCLNFMHSGACKYKDHSDPYTKYPCIMTCIKNCGGGELFLRKFGFFAEYKNGDVLFLKGSKVPHSVNGLITSFN